MTKDQMITDLYDLLYDFPFKQKEDLFNRLLKIIEDEERKSNKVTYKDK
jgi:hypothetical protein